MYSITTWSVGFWLTTLQWSAAASLLSRKKEERDSSYNENMSRRPCQERKSSTLTPWWPKTWWDQERGTEWWNSARKSSMTWWPKIIKRQNGRGQLRRVQFISHSKSLKMKRLTCGMPIILNKHWRLHIHARTCPGWEVKKDMDKWWVVRQNKMMNDFQDKVIRYSQVRCSLS